MAILAVLQYPDRGEYAPTKYGTRHGDFLKSKVPGMEKEIWVLGGRTYDLSKDEDREDFNEACSVVIPFCHGRKMRVVPLILKSVAAKKAAKKKVARELPAKLSPPSGG
jgi:hypothetical protein